MEWNTERARVLGVRIRELRKQRGLSQERAAFAAGITKNLLQLLEAGRSSAREDGRPSNPHIRTIYGIATALEVDPRDLLPVDEVP